MPQRRSHGRSLAKPNHFRRPKSYTVVCSGCGKEVISPVLPPDDKKLLCMECFNKSGSAREDK